MLYNNIKPTSKIILLFTTLLLPSFAFAQANDLAIQLRLKLESNDTTQAKWLLAKSLQNKYFLLVDCEDQDVDSVEVQILSRVNHPDQILETRRESIPYLSIQDTVNEYIELAFILIKDTLMIPMEDTYKPIDCSRGHLAYLFLRNNGTIDLKYCLELPEPPDIGRLGVLFSGMIASGSFIWFLVERNKANDNFDKYRSAISTPEAVKLRHEVGKSRTRRDIAGVISLVSGVAFTYFLVRYLFCSESKEFFTHDIRSLGSTPKVKFGLETNPITNDVLVTMSLQF